MPNDPIKEAYTPVPLPKQSSAEMEKGIRSDRAAVQSVNKLSPEQYQKDVNEDRSNQIAGRMAWEASTDKQKAKIAGYGKHTHVKGSFASGGTIPETGLYKMHAGEKVIPTGDAFQASGGKSMGHGKHTGEAEHMHAGGSDESSGKRQNSPFRALHEGGHAVNHSYKNPVASLLGETGAVNHSYLHPLDHGAGPEPEVPKGSWAKPSSIKPMSQQGKAGKIGGTIV